MRYLIGTLQNVKERVKDFKKRVKEKKEIKRRKE